MLASKFSRNTSAFRSDFPLSDDQIRKVAPSIFAVEPHESRTARYSYIPTIEVLDRLRNEGFQPFMVCQARCRDEGKREHTKHMLRLRHANQINSAEANEIILLNSHDGTSSYQMMSGMFRFVCQNGLVFGNMQNDIRIPHKGQIVDNVIDGAIRVLEDFELVEASADAMRSIQLDRREQEILARAALRVKYEPTDEKPAPITESQLLTPQRRADTGNDLWSTFNRVQEHIIKGGLRGRTATGQVRTTREVTGIDSNVKLNRALWQMAEEMAALKR